MDYEIGDYIGIRNRENDKGFTVHRIVRINSALRKYPLYEVNPGYDGRHHWKTVDPRWTSINKFFREKIMLPSRQAIHLTKMEIAEHVLEQLGG